MRAFFQRRPIVWLYIIALVWLGLFPLASGLTYTRITQDKWIAMWIGCGLSTLCAAMYLLLARRRPRLSVQAALALGLLCWAAITAVAGTERGARNQAGQLIAWIGSGRYEGLAAQIAYTLILCCASLAPLSLTLVSSFAAGGIALYTAVVLLQYAGLNPLGLFPAGRSILTNYEFQGTIGNIDMVVGYLSVAAPLAAACWICLGEKRRLPLLAAALCAVELCFLMEVQMSYLAILTGLLLCLWSAIRHPKHRARAVGFCGGVCLCLALRRMIRLPWLDGSAQVVFDPLPDAPAAAVLIAGSALLVLAALLVRHPGKALRYPCAIVILGLLLLAFLLCIALLPVPQEAGGLWELNEILHGRAEDSFGSWRWGVWRHSWHLFVQHPILGTGPDGFRHAMTAHLAAEGASLGEFFDNPHNVYLSVLVSYGLPGIALYLGLIVSCLRACFRRGGEASAMAAPILCYSVQAFFSFSICIITPIAWCALGLAAAHTDPSSFRRKPVFA